MAVYLDYNASTPIDERVINAMVKCYRNYYGNSDSRTHEFGDNARKQIEEARKNISDLVGCNKDEVFFTSGATESNNIALLGLKEYGIQNRKTQIITSSIEHKAVIEAAHHLEKEGFYVDYVAPDEKGEVSCEKILSLVSDKTLVVSLMHVNNETGTIQPVLELGKALKEKGVLFHIDATQSCGKMVEEIRELDYDMMTIGAHKMYGPQGIGALILKRKRYKLPPIKPIMFGGPQEHGIRPGTLPTSLIVGFGESAKIAMDEYKEDAVLNRKIKSKLLSMLDESNLEYAINGDLNNSIPNTLNISILGVVSEALMISTKKYCGISNGSACNSKSYSLSYVLEAMGLPKERLISAIRISWGKGSDIEDVVKDFGGLIENAEKLVK